MAGDIYTRLQQQESFSCRSKMASERSMEAGKEDVDEMLEEDKGPVELTDNQKARIERNRQRALLLRQARLTGIKRNNPEEAVTAPAKIRIKKDDTISLLACQQDTGAGFFLEDDDDDSLATAAIPALVEEPAPPDLERKSNLSCGECKEEFTDSYLLKKFDVLICDNCKSEEKHGLLTKSDVKQKYLLKDCDLDMRTPILKFLLKKNPHNDRWGQMKLYYKPHIVTRAIEVWGSLEKIEDEKDKRCDNKEKTKQKKFEKRIKELRRAVRTSTWQKVDKKHEHDYDDENEEYDSEEDVYSKKCRTCGYVLNYEKM